MGEWTFRIFGEPIALDPNEQREVSCEIARLQSLIRRTPANGRVRVNQNPAGLAGEYASLLIDATVRGYAAEEIVPVEVRRRYGGCYWFAACQEVLSAFRLQWTEVRAEAGELDEARRH